MLPDTRPVTRHPSPPPPSQAQGVRIGDIIRAVNGTALLPAEMTLQEVLHLIQTAARPFDVQVSRVILRLQ